MRDAARPNWAPGRSRGDQCGPVYRRIEVAGRRRKSAVAQSAVTDVLALLQPTIARARTSAQNEWMRELQVTRSGVRFEYHADTIAPRHNPGDAASEPGGGEWSRGVCGTNLVVSATWAIRVILLAQLAEARSLICLLGPRTCT